MVFDREPEDEKENAMRSSEENIPARETASVKALRAENPLLSLSKGMKTACKGQSDRRDDQIVG